MISDPDPELGMASQLSSIIRLLLDPDNMLAASVVNVSVSFSRSLLSCRQPHADVERLLSVPASSFVTEIGENGFPELFLQELHARPGGASVREYRG